MRRWTVQEAVIDEIVQLTTEFIKLDALLKVAGVAGSGGQAKQMIREGLLSLNGEQTTQRGRKVRPGDVVEVASDPVIRILVQAADG